jgi:hypothetical protein
MAPHEHVEEVIDPFARGAADFDSMVSDWVPLTLLVNSLNRSLGQEDAYPFALSPAAIEKLRFVHEVIRESASMQMQNAKDAKIPQRAQSS